MSINHNGVANLRVKILLWFIWETHLLPGERVEGGHMAPAPPGIREIPHYYVGRVEICGSLILGEGVVHRPLEGVEGVHCPLEGVEGVH